MMYSEWDESMKEGDVGVAEEVEDAVDGAVFVQGHGAALDDAAAVADTDHEDERQPNGPLIGKNERVGRKSGKAVREERRLVLGEDVGEESGDV